MKSIQIEIPVSVYGEERLEPFKDGIKIAVALTSSVHVVEIALDQLFNCGIIVGCKLVWRLTYGLAESFQLV